MPNIRSFLNVSNAIALAAIMVALSGCSSGSGGSRAEGEDRKRPSRDQEVLDGAAAESITRAEMHRAEGDLNAALAEFERAIEVNPDLTVAYLGAGDIYRERGDYPEAERRYDRINGEQLKLPSYAAAAAREGARALLVGSESEVEEAVAGLFTAGVTDLVALPIARRSSNDEARTNEFLARLRRN